MRLRGVSLKIKKKFQEIGEDFEKIVNCRVNFEEIMSCFKKFFNTE